MNIYLIYELTITLLGKYLQKCIHMSKDMYEDFHNSTIHNSQKLETKYPPSVDICVIFLQREYHTTKMWVILSQKKPDTK